MRVWITGASGFVGGATVRRLADRGDEIVAITRRTSASRVDRRATIAVAELPDLATLDDAPDPDVIIHCASVVYPKGSDAERRSRAVNVDATLALAARAKRNGARFIHLSSIDVYERETSTSIIDEDSPTGPHEPYGRTKLEGELRLREAIPDAIILRPPGIYGPGSRMDYVQEVIRQIIRRRFFYVGDGRALRSWVFVENLVDAIMLAVDGRMPSGTYLVDDGAPVEQRALVRSVARALGVRPWFPHVPISVAHAVAYTLERACPRLGVAPPLTTRGVRFLASAFPLDTRRIRATGFEPSWSFQSGIDATVRWVITSRVDP